jgi:hypothetical protein
MLGKLPSQLLRLSGIVQMIHEAYDYSVKSKFKHLSVQFSLQLDKDLENISSVQKKISKDNIIRGYKLLSYFNKTKLVLAGFDSDWDIPFDTIIENLSSNDTNIQNEENFKFLLIKYVLQSDESKFDCSVLQQKHKHKGIKKNHVVKAMNLLESFKIGKLTTIKNFHGKYIK